MKLSAYENQQIKSYVDAVRAHLSGPDREETLAGIESHIHAGVEARRQTGEEGNLVAAVLAEMDAPEQYGDSTGPAPLRMSKLAVASACLLATTVGVGLVYIGLEGRYGVILVPLFCAFGLLSIILAKTAIEQIKRSGGMLTGMRLALICYLLPVVGSIYLLANLPLAIPYPREQDKSIMRAVTLGIVIAAAAASVIYIIYEIRSTRRDTAAPPDSAGKRIH